LKSPRRNEKKFLTENNKVTGKIKILTEGNKLEQGVKAGIAIFRSVKKV